MPSDSGLISQDSDYARHIQEVLNELRQMQQTPQLVTSPEELEALECEMRQRTDRVGSLLVGHHMQQALDAAALVLAESPDPLNCRRMIEAMAAKGYWTSPGGKTPASTLYAAILKEIVTKDKESRFRITARGKFART